MARQPLFLGSGGAVTGTYETFEVVEVNERHGFARVRSDRTGTLYHTELVPEGQGDRLRVGDRIRGLQRGQSVGRVAWVARAPPEPAAVARAEALLADLGRFGYQLPVSAAQIADAEGRAEQAGAISSILGPRFPAFFAEQEVQDASLLERFEAAMAPYLQDFKVKPVAREARVIVEPG